MDEESAALLQENNEIYDTRHKIENLIIETANLEILRRQYGIDIPNSDLIKVNHKDTVITEESDYKSS